MFKFKNKKTLFSKISLIICLVIMLGFANITSIDVEAETYNTQPTFTMKIDSITPNPANIGEDITVKGTINPQPFESTRQKKQIVLVLDVSGSMKNNDKIGKLKTAATNFVKKMSEIANVEIGIVVFSSEATINPTLYHDDSGHFTTKSTSSIDAGYYDYWHRWVSNAHSIPNYSTLTDNAGNPVTGFLPLDNAEIKTTIENNINDFEALGGTNAGEGLRKAEYMLQNGDPTASKSIIFMSDGLPTFYSVNAPYHTWYTEINNNNASYAGSGSDEQVDNVEKSAEYAVSMGQLIRKLNPKLNIFSIGYDLGDIDSEGNVNMQNIHKAMGGTTGEEGGFFASDVNMIDGVFSQIADKIVSKYVLSDVKIDLTKAVNFNDDFSTISGEKTIGLQSVNYTLKKTDGKKIVYEASPIPFAFTIKGNRVGEYSDAFTGGKLTYLWNGKISDDTNLPPSPITIKDLILPKINAEIDGNKPQDPDPASRMNDITLNYKVNPEKFTINSSVYDKSGPKDIIFLVDTSKSLGDKITKLKSGLLSKIVQDKDIVNARYGIVTFNGSVKSDYISNGLTDDANALKASINSIQGSDIDSRKVGDAMDSATKIFADKGRADSTKYLVIIGSDNLEYTDSQLVNVEKNNFRTVTVNLGYIVPPTKNQDNVIVPGAEESNNNLKALHYNLIGKSDNNDNVLQKADKGYFLNINYSQVTNQTNPNEFFTLEGNSSQMNDPNQIDIWTMSRVADKLANELVQTKTPSYVIKTKLKFPLDGKFNQGKGLNTCSDANYDVETPEFNVIYKRNDQGEYISDPVAIKSFDIKIKDGIDIKDLRFGPGLVSYNDLVGRPTSTVIQPYTLHMKASLDIKSFGIYNGILNHEPSITDGNDKIFRYAKGTSVSLGATLEGALNNDSGVRLLIPNEIIINKEIVVYTYDENGSLTEIGKMNKTSSDVGNSIYTYSGANVDNKKIFILYNEQLPENVIDNTKYVNSLITPDAQRDVTIQVTSDNLPELF